ncbi:MAG: hypothetical protein ACPF9E_11485 [Alteromonas oceani]
MKSLFPIDASGLFTAAESDRVSLDSIRPPVYYVSVPARALKCR